MPTWNQIASTVSNGVTDNTHIYFKHASFPFDIERYTHSTGIATKIGENTEGDNDGRLVFFKGKLYDLSRTSGTGIDPYRGQIKVDRWVGSGTTWTNVDTYTAEDIANEFGSKPDCVRIDTNSFDRVLWNDDYFIVVFSYQTVAFTAGFCIYAPADRRVWCRYTTDGTFWQSATFSDDREAFHTFAFNGFGENTIVAGPAGTKAGLAISLNTPADVTEIYEFVSGVMTLRSGQLTGKVFNGQDNLYFWRSSDAAFTNPEWSVSLSSPSWTATTDTTVRPTTSNFPTPLGWTENPATVFFYHLWDPSINEWQSGLTTLDDVIIMVRLYSGVLLSAMLSNWYYRDTRLIDHLFDIAQILYGRNQLTKQPDSPLNGVLPGAFLRLGTTAFLGGDDGASGVRIAYSLFLENGYPTWVDFTDNYPASAIQALDGTPFGDSEDTEESDSSSGAGGFTDEKGCT